MTEIASSSPRILAEKQGAVGLLTFNNPERHNAVSLDMWAALPGVVAAFDADPDIRAIVVRGAGEKAFVAGADISQFEQNRSDPERAQEYEDVSAAGFGALMTAAKPTIARIHGYCIGGGLGVALSCDIRIAAEGSTFGIPAARLGLAYGIEGTRRLVDVVGPASAKEIFFSARRFTHDEALRMGLVNRVVPLASLDAEVATLCGEIADNAPLTVQTAKLVVDELCKTPGDFDQARAGAAIARCFASRDYQEGRRAFMEKRRPQFEGR